MQPDRTPWFSIAKEPPVRPGVYELMVSAGHTHFSRWNGLGWCTSCRTAKEAAMQFEELKPALNLLRGITKEQG